MQSGALVLRSGGACDLDPDHLLEVVGEQRRRFVAILQGFGPDDWAAPTRCAEWSTHDGVRAEAFRSLALIARRQRRFPDAAEYWRQMLDVPGCPAHFVREATEALAIHHEHREHDLVAAKRFAMLSLESGNGTARGDNLRHRLARIERKLVSERPSLFLSWP